MTLQIRILLERGARADLSEFLPRQPVELVSTTAKGQRRMSVSTVEQDEPGHLRRTLLRYDEDGSSWRALDETTFEADAERIAIVDPRRQRGGPGPGPSGPSGQLPRVMRVGEWCRPIAGAELRVALAAYALVRIDSSEDSASVDVPAIGLLAVEGSRRVLRWSALGVGEIWRGPPRGQPERWLVGARVGGTPFLRAIDDALLARARLPFGDAPATASP